MSESKEVQDWLIEHEEDLNLISSMNGWNRTQSIIHILNLGVDKANEELSEMVVNEEAY